MCTVAYQLLHGKAHWPEQRDRRVIKSKVQAIIHKPGLFFSRLFSTRQWHRNNITLNMDWDGPVMQITFICRVIIRCHMKSTVLAQVIGHMLLRTEVRSINLQLLRLIQSHMHLLSIFYSDTSNENHVSPHVALLTVEYITMCRPV